MHPRRHRVLERALRRAKGNQRQFLRRISARFESTLSGSNIEARVESREKHLYSIYRKMQTKGRSLAEIVGQESPFAASSEETSRAPGQLATFVKKTPEDPQDASLEEAQQEVLGSDPDIDTIQERDAQDREYQRERDILDQTPDSGPTGPDIDG